MTDRIACRACGKWMFHLAQVCPHCGAPQADPPPPKPPPPADPKPREPLRLSPEEARALLSTATHTDDRGSGFSEVVTELVAWRGNPVDLVLSLLAMPLTAPTVLTLGGAMRTARRKGIPFDFRGAKLLSVPSSAGLYALLLWQAEAPAWAWGLLATSFVAWAVRTVLRARATPDL